MLCVLSLTSCLREATPIIKNETQTEQTTVSMAETDSQDTTDAVTDTEDVTEPEPDEPDVEPNVEVVKWTSRHPSPTTVIMTADEIEAENRRMAEDSESLIDIFSFGDTVSAAELRSLIGRHSVPPEERYDSDGAPISKEHKEKVKERMNIGDAESFKTEHGIMTSRGNLRAVPDKMPYHKSPDNRYDSIQNTELAVGTPVLVLYTTYDSEYYFIVSGCYSGWMKTSDVALSDDIDLWMSFAAPERFVCMTDALYRDGEQSFDMGCILPLVSKGQGGYNVLSPVRNEAGKLDTRELTVPKVSAVEGYLPYTYENYLNQAFKYEGTEYGWGGLNDGVDCSGFVLNVFKCFGFRFPRDTKDQDKVVGCALDVAGQSHNYIAASLDGNVPTVVYYPGHTLLYIGFDESDGKYYFIHAPKIGERVSVTSKSDLSGMTYIGQVGEYPTS